MAGTIELRGLVEVVWEGPEVLAEQESSKALPPNQKGTMRGHGVSIRCSSRKMMNRGTIVTTNGSIRVASATPNQNVATREADAREGVPGHGLGDERAKRGEDGDEERVLEEDVERVGGQRCGEVLPHDRVGPERRGNANSLPSWVTAVTHIQ